MSEAAGKAIRIGDLANPVLSEALKAALPALIGALPFPKSMRWLPGERVSFARPVRYLLCLLGKEGLREAAAHCHAKAEFLKRRLSFARLLNPGPTFNEFAIRLPRKAQEVCAALAEQGYLAGLPLSAVGRGEETDLLVAVTEQRTRAQLDAFAEALARACR